MMRAFRRRRFMAVASAVDLSVGFGTASSQGPSFACGKVQAGSIEQMVCEDAGLLALDRQLAGVYAAAMQKAANEQPPVLIAERGDTVSLMVLQPSASGTKISGAQ